jgi:hypothetical protein
MKRENEKPKPPTIHIQLTQEQHKALKHHALFTDTTVSELVRGLIERQGWFKMPTWDPRKGKPK